MNRTRYSFFFVLWASLAYSQNVIVIKDADVGAGITKVSGLLLYSGDTHIRVFKRFFIECINAFKPPGIMV